MVRKLLLISITIIIIDRITKLLAETKVNTGAAFSLFQGYNSFLIIISIIVVLVILYYRNHSQQIALGFLLGGTVSNLIDRIFYNGILDFIHLIYWNTNIADLSNIVAALLLVKYFWKNP